MAITRLEADEKRKGLPLTKEEENLLGQLEAKIDEHLIQYGKPGCGSAYCRLGIRIHSLRDVAWKELKERYSDWDEVDVIPDSKAGNEAVFTYSRYVKSHEM